MLGGKKEKKGDIYILGRLKVPCHSHECHIALPLHIFILNMNTLIDLMHNLYITYSENENQMQSDLVMIL